jgi:hypothetical protein
LGSPPAAPLTDEELLVANDFFLKAADKKRKAELLAAIKQVSQTSHTLRTSQYRDYFEFS